MTKETNESMIGRKLFSCILITKI